MYKRSRRSAFGYNVGLGFIRSSASSTQHDPWCISNGALCASKEMVDILRRTLNSLLCFPCVEADDVDLQVNR